jgi:hypothetical protein
MSLVEGAGEGRAASRLSGARHQEPGQQERRGGAAGGAALGEEKGRWLGAAVGRDEQIREQKGRNRKVGKGASAEKEGGGRKGDRRGEGKGSLGGGRREGKGMSSM